MPGQHRERVRHRSDWSWVGTEVHAAADITPAHRQRAAGLVAPQCPYLLPALQAGIKDAKDQICRPKKCKESPRCYNHLGAERLVDDAYRDEQIEEKLGPAAAVRDGPAGLRNFGATCYLWYQNVAFRNGVYNCVGATATPLSHLAQVFASLQCSVKKVVNPEPLIDALRLDKGDQQDAAEFSKLFMSLVDSEFSRQNGPLKSFVKDQFEGRLAYVTRCQVCGYTSRSPSAFLELEIGLKDKCHLQDQLKRMCTPELLDGDNRYRCPQCQALRPATRTLQLEAFPPTLHFSLLRFVYDPATGTRKKSKASIAYPHELVLVGKTYDLRGIVTHHGASAFHGHFTCEVYDAARDARLLCDDESVSIVPDRPAKRFKVFDADDLASGDQVSKDAYMLVYQERGPPTPAHMPPAVLLDFIQADNAAIQASITERETRRQQMVDEWAVVKDAKLRVLNKLPGEECIVPRDALASWIVDMWPAGRPAFDFTPLMCQHGNLDGAKAAETRLISAAALTELQQLCDVATVTDVCAKCVDVEFARRLARHDHARVVSTFDDLVLTGSGDWLIPRAWLKPWRNGSLASGVSPAHPDVSILCEHGRPWQCAAGKVDVVTGEAVAHLQSLYGGFPVFTKDTDPCAVCTTAVAARTEADREETDRKKRERQVFKSQRNVSVVFHTPNFLVPPRFFAAWELYLGSMGDRPTLRPELCEHGLIALDPTMDPADYLTEAGWRTLCDLYQYDADDGISMEYLSHRNSDRRFAIGKVSKPTCQPCRRRKLLDFDETRITIVLGKGRAPSADSTSDFRRTSRSNPKEVSFTVSKETTVKDIKVEIMNVLQVSPICQRLYYRDRVLDSSETVASVEVLANDHLNLEEVVEVEDFEDAPVTGQRRKEGFGGTALLGRIACATCTYDNATGAAACDMCDTPL